MKYVIVILVMLSMAYCLTLFLDKGSSSTAIVKQENACSQANQDLVEFCKYHSQTHCLDTEQLSENWVGRANLRHNGGKCEWDVNGATCDCDSINATHPRSAKEIADQQAIEDQKLSMKELVAIRASLPDIKRVCKVHPENTPYIENTKYYCYQINQMTFDQLEILVMNKHWNVVQ